MNSRLYTGVIAHSRSRPAKNAFRYPAYYLALDLDELKQINTSFKRLSYNKPGFVSFWDQDHGARDGSPLKPWITSLVSGVGVDLTGGRVLLLTFPRVLGARFYPVSFWYCFGRDGAPLAVLAEVHNTHHDRHNYLLHNGGEPYDWSMRPRKRKAFFVSPFVQIEDVEYEFAFSEPAEHLEVTIRDIVEGSQLLVTTLALEAQPLTDSALMRTVMRHGPISIVALLRIHWQAIKLLGKRVPFHAHTPPPAEETS